MKRLTRLTALLSILLFCLSGCQRQSSGAQFAESVSLPEPEREADQMLLGEQKVPYRTDITVYHISSDGMELAPVPRTFMAADRDELAREALESMLTPLGASGATSVAPSETKLISVESTADTFTVNLSVDARNVQSQQEMYMMFSAITCTLMEIHGTRGVNILVGGQCETAFRLPAGVLSMTAEDVLPTAARLQAESDRFLGDDLASRGSISRGALIYYPDASSGLLLPELKELTFSDQNWAGALLTALRTPPTEGTGCLSPMPSGLDMLVGTPNTLITEEGMRVLDLSFTALADVYLESVGLTRTQFAASLTVTLCSFLPELDGVRIYIDGEPLNEIVLSGTEVTLVDGIHTRERYEDAIGCAIDLYFAGEEGGLTRRTRVVSRESGLSPKIMLEELFFGPLAAEDAVSALPEGATAQDVLGVSVSGDIARVNLSGNFYRLCQSLSDTAERNAAYAMVNTLMRMDGVRAVKILFEGSPAERLSDLIYLGGTLTYNPGIVEERVQEVDETVEIEE